MFLYLPYITILKKWAKALHLKTIKTEYVWNNQWIAYIFLILRDILTADEILEAVENWDLGLSFSLLFVNHLCFNKRFELKYNRFEFNLHPQLWFSEILWQLWRVFKVVSSMNQPSIYRFKYDRTFTAQQFEGLEGLSFTNQSPPCNVVYEKTLSLQNLSTQVKSFHTAKFKKIGIIVWKYITWFPYAIIISRSSKFITLQGFSRHCD